MPVFEYESHFPFLRSDVFHWYERPGALVRLHPPFAGSVLKEPTQGISAGSESTLGINPPGLAGTVAAALAGMASSMTPLSLRASMPWKSRHVDYVSGRGFSDEMISGPAKSWHHERSLEDTKNGTVLKEAAHYELPALDKLPKPLRAVVEAQFEKTFQAIFDFRTRQTLAELQFHSQYGNLASQQQEAPDASTLVIAITGASGMIGEQVRAICEGAGATVVDMVRGVPSEKARAQQQIGWDPTTGELDAADFAEVDVVIHLAGAPLIGRFTQEHKHKVKESRRQGTTLIAEKLAQAQKLFPRERALISGSAVGFYGATAQNRDHSRDILDESLSAGDDFLAEVCQVWEESTAAAARAGVRVAMIRTGIVQSPRGGVLQQFLPLYAAGVGGRLGSGERQSWISIDDIAGLIVHAALSSHVSGPVNGVAPHPVTAAQYAKTLGEVLNRPAAIPVPKFGPDLLLGSEGTRQIAMADQNVSADKAVTSGYAFRHRELGQALHHILGR